MRDLTNMKDVLAYSEDFESFILDYFINHKELTGSYETREYFEYYRARYDSKKGIILNIMTGLNSSTLGSPMPFKQTETITIEEFRQLILNKRFADTNETLADVFSDITLIPAN
ncbi:hypothetical protein [Lentilactobacillus sp. Marseille-Q4993]|uniref:hypothetical protein n=1 Tax=Lentilactobacillus sp. Marseille-Q4993 TaxID=3039492 RepID=UPI0024BC08C2|nr:hypothetical protein [Lentilactobacillus sp. Marseille-Q4993]